MDDIGFIPFSPFSLNYVSFFPCALPH